MGDLRVLTPRPNDVVLVGSEYRTMYPFSSSSSSSSSSEASSPLLPAAASNPNPASIAEDCWERAEEASLHIIRGIQPTLAAELKRKEVVHYIQQLIKNCTGCEVFPYGSVPLKTFLPDGDIDLTALCTPAVEDALVADVLAALRQEECTEAARFEVKDVHFIDAEVKLVKCIVQNVVVDISFNQLGGLCTLCFLEQVDRLVGKGHLFKRSVILIKAWCYYESRILGAHHGLISTYALEVLVLYIFQFFGSSLNGPLAVLYRFLDCFNKFDWDYYCLSLNGPVCKSSLPHKVAEVPENLGDGLLLSEEFLKSCALMFSVPSKGPDMNSRAFPQKHLNIIDPLKENNNLGRSVNRGNFIRIRSAFRRGAHKLGQILLLPEERIADELSKFFTNTLDRHRSDCIFEDQATPESYSPRDRNSVSGHHHVGDARELATCGLLAMRKKNGSSNCSQLSSDLSTLLAGKSRLAPHFYFAGLFRENRNTRGGNDCQKAAANTIFDNEKFPEIKESHPVPNYSVCSTDTHDGLTFTDSAVYTPIANMLKSSSPGYGERDLPGISEALNSSLDLTGDYDTHIKSLMYGQFCHVYSPSNYILPSPHISQLQNTNVWEIVRQSLEFNNNVYPQLNSDGIVLGAQFNTLNTPRFSSAAFGYEDNKPRGIGTYFPKMNYQQYRERPSRGRGKNQAPGTHGHFQKHTYKNGYAATSWEMNSFGGDELSQAEDPSAVHGKFRSSDAHQSHPFMWGTSHGNGFSHQSESWVQSHSSSNGLATAPHANFLPNGKCRSPESYQSQPSMSGSYDASGFSSLSEILVQKRSHNNGLATAPREMNGFGASSHELSEAEFPILGHGKSDLSDSLQFCSSVWGSHHANCLPHPSERHESDESIVPQACVASLSEGSRLDSSTLQARGSSRSHVPLEVQSPKSEQGNELEKVAEQSYHLKDEDEFPPLSL